MFTYPVISVRHRVEDQGLVAPLILSFAQHNVLRRKACASRRAVHSRTPTHSCRDLELCGCVTHLHANPCCSSYMPLQGSAALLHPASGC